VTSAAIGNEKIWQTKIPPQCRLNYRSRLLRDGRGEVCVTPFTEISSRIERGKRERISRESEEERSLQVFWTRWDVDPKELRVDLGSERQHYVERAEEHTSGDAKFEQCLVCVCSRLAWAQVEHSVIIKKRCCTRSPPQLLGRAPSYPKSWLSRWHKQ
jgi:hypothetical protein